MQLWAESAAQKPAGPPVWDRNSGNRKRGGVLEGGPPGLTAPPAAWKLWLVNEPLRAGKGGAGDRARGWVVFSLGGNGAEVGFRTVKILSHKAPQGVLSETPTSDT